MFSGAYELPFGRGRTYLSRGPISRVLGGWNLGAVHIAQSGQPLTPSASPNQCNCFSAGGVRPNLVGDPKGPMSIDNWFNLAAFEHPGTFKFGNSGRGVVIGPGLWTLDLNLSKDFAITETKKFNFRGDAFNSLNHSNFDPPSLSIFPKGAVGTTNVIRSAGDPRLLQISARFIF